MTLNADAAQSVFNSIGLHFEIPSSYRILLLIVAIAGLVYLLFLAGVIGKLIGWLSALIRAVVRGGYTYWDQLFSWAYWPQLLIVVVAVLTLGVNFAESIPGVAVLCGLVSLFVGAITCLAYMYIDIERYEVERGYKAVHNPLKGQVLAVHLIRHGSRVGVPLLVVAAVGAIGGFALLNQGLYESVGRAWYAMGVEKSTITYTDFLAYSLISLYRVVDLLDTANSYQFLNLSHVRQSQWPAGILLTIYKTFFTLVLLQQIFASIRQGQALAESIADFWSPHPPIHERARNSLPQHGVGVVQPLLESLRTIPAMTHEQRDQLPLIIATLGPSSIPALMYHLADSHEGIRAVAVASLGRLHALDALPNLVRLQNDSSEIVRQELVEALGVIGSLGYKSAEKLSRLRPNTTAAPRRYWLLNRRRKSDELGPTGRWELLLETLRAALADASSSVRVRAVEAVGLLGPAASTVTPDVIASLNDPDETVQTRAAETLGLIGDERAVDALIGKLSDPSPLVKESVAKSLGSFARASDRVVPPLVELLKNAEENVRNAAMTALGKMDSLPSTATASLVEGLQSADSLVRVQAAEALVVIGKAAPDAAPALVASLTNGNDHVRAKAAEALGQIGDAAGTVAVPGLVLALRDKNTWVTALAAEALGKIGESAEGAIPDLIRSLKHINPLVRANSATALGKMGETATLSLATLRDVTRDVDGGVRAQAFRAIGLIAPAETNTSHAIREALSDTDPRVRAAAAETLGEQDISDPTLANDLLAMLNDANDEVKYRTILALPRTPGSKTEVVEGLCQRLLEDDSPWIQFTAAQTLGQLGAAAIEAGPTLLRAVRTAEASVREQALRAIVFIQPPETAEALMEGMKDALPEMRVMATAGWMKATAIPDAAVPALIENLRDPEVQVRANAALAVSRLEAIPSEAIPLLLACISDSNDGLRLNAVLALREKSSDVHADTWGRLLEDPNTRIRVMAAGTILFADPVHAASLAIVRASLADPALRIRQLGVEIIASTKEAGFPFLDDLKLRAGEEQNDDLKRVMLELTDRLDGTAKATPLASPE